MANAISIHIPRVGDDVGNGQVYTYYSKISIHIPRVGDDRDLRGRGALRHISIHIPRVGDDES